MAAKVLGLVTLSSQTFHLFISQIAEFYGDEVSVDGFWLESGKRKSIDAACVLVSSSGILEPAIECLRSDADVFTARRTVNLARVIELFELPRGTAVLVANNIPETSSETIRLFEELGLDHLEYIPYWPGKPDRVRAEVVVVPGLESLAPPGCRRVINIGVRPLDLSTLVEIGLRLGLSMDKANIVAMRQAREIVALTKKQKLLVEDLNEINTKLKVIIDSVHDGIIAADASGRITLMNQVAKKMLGVRSDMAGRPVDELPGQVGLFGQAGGPDSETEGLVKVNNKDILVTRKPVAGQAGSVIITRDVTELQRVEHDVRQRLRDKGFVTKYSFDDIVGSSKRIRHAVEVAQKLAQTALTVLILGENGTGKELFAHAIHAVSPMKEGPFIAVNFAALPESLVESELFGYEEGAFTGARRGGKAGLFEQAHNGTIFLDEIGDLPPSIQIRLLRVLQEKEVMRIGASRVIPVNVRVIAATNRDLRNLVQEGKFREDLYYRLYVSPLKIPPLRERKEDIEPLIAYFLKKYGGPKELPESVVRMLKEHDWPGNVRELEGVIRYILTIAPDDREKMEGLLEDLFPKRRENSGGDGCFDAIRENLRQRASLAEFRAILAALARAQAERRRLGRGSVRETPEVIALGLTHQMVRLRLKALGDEGLVSIGKGRQGTTITDKGIEFLKYLNGERT